MEKREKILYVFSDQFEQAEAWIKECEKQFSHRLDTVAKDICENHPSVRLLRLSGPTCSGKTTAAELLARRFEKYGKRLHLVSIDDFYYDKDVLHSGAEDHESGNVDYDSVKTIDLQALAKFTEEIFSGDVGCCPIFDFKEGRRVGYRQMESGPDDVFVFEGIQSGYPEVTAILSAGGHGSLGIYIAPASSIDFEGDVFEPNEIRFLRRLMRDYIFRGTLPALTMGLWSGVRSNEETNIFPYISNYEYHIDSTVPYELGILKCHLPVILELVPNDNVHRPKADEILKRLASVPLLSDSLLPEDSLYQEFI